MICFAQFPYRSKLPKGDGPKLPLKMKKTSENHADQLTFRFPTQAAPTGFKDIRLAEAQGDERHEPLPFCPSVAMPCYLNISMAKTH